MVYIIGHVVGTKGGANSTADATIIDVKADGMRRGRPTLFGGTYIAIGFSQAGLSLVGSWLMMGRPFVQSLDIFVIEESLMMMMVLMSQILSIGGTLPQNSLGR